MKAYGMYGNLFGLNLLTYLNESTMAVMIPVTKMTIPRTQKSPWHFVKSTFRKRHENNLQQLSSQHFNGQH